MPGEESSVEEVGEFGRIYYIKAGFSPIFEKRYRLMLPWNTYIPNNSPIKRSFAMKSRRSLRSVKKYTLSLMAGLLRKHIMNVGSKRPMLVQFSCERMDDNVSSFIPAGRISNWFTVDTRRTTISRCSTFIWQILNIQERIFRLGLSLENPHRLRPYVQLVLALSEGRSGEIARSGLYKSMRSRQQDI